MEDKKETILATFDILDNYKRMLNKIVKQNTKKSKLNNIVRIFSKATHIIINTITGILFLGTIGGAWGIFATMTDNGIFIIIAYLSGFLCFPIGYLITKPFYKLEDKAKNNIQNLLEEKNKCIELFDDIYDATRKLDLELIKDSTNIFEINTNLEIINKQKQQIDKDYIGDKKEAIQNRYNDLTKSCNNKIELINKENEQERIELLCDNTQDLVQDVSYSLTMDLGPRNKSLVYKQKK